ncbi:MAG: PAS domain S-box protein, partial [Oceanidesulfovibrio sp.]
MSDKRVGSFNRERFKVIFENAPLGVFTSTPEGRFLEVNPALARMLGYAKPAEVLAEITDVSRQIYADPEHRHQVVATIRKESGVKTFHNVYKKRDGSLFTAMLRACLIDDPEYGPCVLGLVEDVTDELRMQRELAESELRHRSLFENAPVGIYQSTFDGVYLNANPEFARLHGYDTPQELIGDVVDSSRQLYADPNRRRELLETLEREGEAVNFEALARRKDGSTFWSLRNVRLMRNTDGSCHHLKGFVTDISERKQLEAMREDVERIIRHDLKSPVIALLSGLKMLSWHSLPQEDHELVTELQETAQRMLTLLDLSGVLHKIEQGNYKCDTRPVDVMTLLNEVAETLNAAHPSKSIDIRTQPDAPGCHIIAEPMLARTVLENLLKNALEATPVRGAVHVRVAVQETCTVAIHNAQPVPESVRDCFFDKYATAGKSSGTGLGTYTAKKYTEAMGGCIEMTTSE